jgi:signal transduction histidine kinase
MSQEGFIVDTHLLRELGDLLVGRDSTAILELVKNGYDADATVVRIDAQSLAHPDEAMLTVEDNGNGMTAARFRSAFLRIAGRDKEEGERQSPKYRRAYTGQKGIGRLASQKLAKVLEVHSVPDHAIADSGGPGVEARIDWAEIDQQETLHELKSGLSVTDVPVSPGAPPGTVLLMRSLKRTWTAAEIGKFVEEMQSAQPPSLLLASDSESLAIAGEPLIGTPRLRSTAANDPGFELELSGELASGDDLWAKAAEDFQWCIEIDVANGRTRYRVSPTHSYAREEPLARVYSFEATTDPTLRFQARFYVMPGASTRRGPLRGFVRSTSGIRVYMEGFRVLPYAEYGDDWLETDREYRSGPRYYSIAVDEQASDDLAIDSKEGLSALPSNAYFGAVFLTSAGAPGLESLINREGFVPGRAFHEIRQIVQVGIRLSIRVRRSVFNQRNTLNAVASAPPEEPRATPPPLSPGPGPAFDTAGRQPFEMLAYHGPTPDDDRMIVEAAAAAAALVASPQVGASESTDDHTRQLVSGFNAARIALQTVQSYQPELRILAGVGLQLGAFVHDINGMLASATTIRELLRGLLERVVEPAQRNVLQVTLRTADELAHTLVRQSSYLTDVLSADPRRRRSKVKIHDRVESVLRFLAGSLSAKAINVSVDVEADLRTGPMFPAEVMIMLTNLLTNAVKNAADGGNIWIDGRDLGDSVVIVVSNDGMAVDLKEAERWFLPFESTTTIVDEVLGQGLGLGLPIVRALTDDYRGDVRFIEPAHAPGTSIRVTLPKKGKVQ